MSAYDSDAALHGAKTARMEQRTTARVKEMIEQAAMLLGINASEFTVAAAAKAARETMRGYETTILTKQDHAAFLKAWDAAEPTAGLVELMRLTHEPAKR